MPPFKRTIKQVSTKGLTKTLAVLCVLSLRQIKKRSKKLPDETVLEVNKSEMIIYPNKGGIHTDLFLHKKREPLCTDFLMKSGVIKKGGVVLDIGANIGYYALMEAQVVGEKGKVYAVEPVANNFKLLDKNVSLNNLSNVSTFLYAFGDKNVKAEIFVSDVSNLCAVSKGAVGGKIIGVQPVDMMTTDEFLKDKETPNLIRMDVEGYEYEILKGMKDTLKEDIKILMELHTQPAYMHPNKLQELYQILEDNNFRAKFVVFENKVIENSVIEILNKKSGNQLPIVASNMSIQELKQFVLNYEHLASPNIFFEKERK